MSENRRRVWSGRYVVVYDDRSWEFFRCVLCGELLDSVRARARGLGPVCARKYSAPVTRMYVDQAKAEDRIAYRRAHRKRRAAS